MSPVKLRLAQENLVRSLDDAITERHNGDGICLVVEARTGFGKTLPVLSYGVMLCVMGLDDRRVHRALVKASQATIVVNPAPRLTYDELRTGKPRDVLTSPQLNELHLRKRVRVVYCTSTVQQLEQVGCHSILHRRTRCVQKSTTFGTSL